jgi:Protein of unknown function (DUF3017)
MATAAAGPPDPPGPPAHPEPPPKETHPLEMVAEHSPFGLRNLAYFVVLAIAAGGVLWSVVRSEHWLRGVGVVGVALIVAGLFRAVLSTEYAGLLVLRRRGFDVICYWLLAAAIIGVGVLLPH